MAGNGEFMGPCIPGRGLPQGDPLSSYLFILAAKGLSTLIHDREQRGQLHGCKVARGASSVSHLFFADDSFFFFRVVREEGKVVKQCLQLYERASGQCINFQKSSILFSSKTSVHVRDELCSVLQVSCTDDHGLYLGLPSIIGRNKNEVFSFVKDKVRNKLQSWKNIYLSTTGKEILIKSVAQAIPNYAMSVFLLPLDLCDDLEKMMNSF